MSTQNASLNRIRWAMRWAAVQFALVALVCLVGMILSYRLYSHSPARYFYYLIYLVVIAIAYDNRDKPRVTRAVKALQPASSVECVALLLKCARYTFATRKEAIAKIAEIIPMLDREQAEAVGVKRWRQFYKLLDWEYPEHKCAAFQVATLISDKGAKPLLARLLRHGNIPDDVRKELELQLDKLAV